MSPAIAIWWSRFPARTSFSPTSNSSSPHCVTSRCSPAAATGPSRSASARSAPRSSISSAACRTEDGDGSPDSRVNRKNPLPSGIAGRRGPARPVRYAHKKGYRKTGGSALMLEKLAPSAEQTATQWVGAFGFALTSGDEAALAKLFLPDSHWRNLFGISWQLATFSGNENLCHELSRRASEVRASEFRLDTAALAPRRAVVAGREVIEAIIRFDTVNGPGIGTIRLACPAHAVPVAWTISTTLDFNRICDARSKRNAPISHARDFASKDWFDERRAEIAFESREPDVLVVGGGHAGISAAVELKRIGLDALVIDQAGRVGDNWRLRYRGLKLHNKTPVNHLRYLPFPPTFPDYIPKDKIANWLESYVDIMEINFWTGTTFEGAAYDETVQRWTAHVQRADGT